MRKKWKYLREQFCVELGKISQAHSGDEGSNTESTKWPYFKPLMFLKDVVKPRQTVLSANSNLLITVPVDPASFTDGYGELKDESQDAVCPDDNGSEPETTHSPQEAPISSSGFLSKCRKRCCPSENASIHEIDTKRQQLIKSYKEKEKSDDEDLLFFRSLLPHVRNVHPSQKLLLRTKILEVVSQFVYSQSSVATTHSHFGFKQNNTTKYSSPQPDLD